MMRPFSVKDSGRKLSPHSDVREGDTEEEHIMAEAVTIEEIRAIESLHLPGSVETKSLTNIREALETEKTKYWHKFLKDYSDGPRTEEETDAIQMIYESIHFTDSTSSQDMLDKMMESQPFHENVIGRFAALKERRINLVYVRKIDKTRYKFREQYYGFTVAYTCPSRRTSNYQTSMNMCAASLDVLNDFALKSWKKVKVETVINPLKNKCGISNAMDVTESDLLWNTDEVEPTRHIQNGTHMTTLLTVNVRTCLTSSLPWTTKMMISQYFKYTSK
ncbi:uncharacterized protein [Periplaneta americana]|uniref:uncharacterized protein isoform X2 n=1 Tax=Periplaneta americana TaxID=6978 RepID=UPI0037E934F6